jgi:hypothetical protein
LITLESTVVAGSNQVASNVEGEAVILELGRGTYFGLDPIGTRVWNLIQEPSTVASVCETLVREYDVARARCESDVLSLLAELEDSGLIQVVE